MKRALTLIALGYVLAGLAALGLERAGVYECACEPDCWCKRPRLSVFRWSFRASTGSGPQRPRRTRTPASLRVVMCRS
jgi:hypothetical protein